MKISKLIIYFIFGLILLVTGYVVVVGSFTSTEMRIAVIQFVLIMIIIIGGIYGIPIMMIRVFKINPFRKGSKNNFSQIPDKPIPFGWKGTWLVVKAMPIEIIIKALQLKNCIPCNWKSGIKQGGRLFVSPPIKGWIFIVGQPFPFTDEVNLSKSIKPFLEKASLSVGVIHYFFTYRVTETHCWSKAEDGKIIRGYIFDGYNGKTLWDEGEDYLERELGWNLYNEKGNKSGDKLTIPKEENVMEMARRWCISPSDLKPEFSDNNLGIVGET